MSNQKNLDLAELLPKQYRNRTITTLIRSLFNNHLSKDESVILYGFAGSEQKAEATDIYIREADLERQVNQLSPVLYSKQGVEERLITWRELVQRLVTLGVPYDSIGDWLKVEALNFMPFIDLDKFCNFNEYVWVGNWVLSQPTLPWHTLGIPASEAVAALTAFNADSIPDYYVIQRSALDGSNVPVAPYPGLSSWSDWALGNMWVHKADAFAFQLAHSTLNTNKLTQAIRPILEFESNLKLNLHFQAGEPADAGTLLGQAKTAPNQLPLFDLYYHDGSHTTYISAGFFYKEGADQPIDEALGRRIVRDSAADLIFSHSFTDPAEDRPLFLKRYNGTAFVLASPWRGPHDLEQSFVKYETAGTLVNADKLQNYESYYWAGAADGLLPGYNPLATAEYVVIEAGGVSGWSLDNRWKHVSVLTSEQRLDYLQAQRPIVEFNKGLETELLGVKTTLAQHPQFKLYNHDAFAGTYTQLPDPANDRLTDAYTQAKLFVDLDDLELTKRALLTSSEQASLLLSIRGHQFAQTLLTGYYSNELDGTAYSYSGREFERLGAGDGPLSIISLDSDALPQVFQLSCLSDGVTFTVYSTVLGALPNLTLGVPYSIAGSTFTVVAGLTAFDDTSIIRFEIKSSVFKKTNLFVKLDNSYRTVASLDGYLRNASLDSRLVTTDTASAGAWKCPEAFFGNLDSVTAASFRQGDLYSHFLTMIEAQPGLIGTASGQNSWRNLLTHDFSLGGLIKLFNKRLPLLLGMLCQDAADPISLIGFSQEAYTAVLNRSREFVEQELLEHIVAGDASFLSASGDIDQATYALLRSYLERKSTVVASSSSNVDDIINTPFANTSLTLKALTLTAPYLGLSPKVQPTIAYDVDQNMTVLVHHDGHSSSLPNVEFSTLKRLVTKRFKRSNGQETAGFVGGPVPPTAPFKQQLWLDLSGERLYVFDVVSDLGVLPAIASNGQFSYDRQTGQTWQYNGSWVSLGSTQSAQEAPWRALDLASTLTALLLKLENELYAGCPALPPALNVTSLQANTRWPALMQREFELFASKFGIVDPYECSYDPTNPFTWSYVNSGLGVSNPAVWQEVYRQVYGTSRPDLYPYVSCGFSTDAAFIATMISLGALPLGTTAWTTSYWTQPLAVAAIKALLSSQSRPTNTSVNLATGQLLPPYSASVEALLAVPPPNPTQRFQYGDLGPIERAWTRTLDYITSTIKTYFRLDPLTFIDSCWGDERLRIDNYDIIRPLGRKAHIVDVLLHGEPINRTTIATNALSLTCTLAPLAPTSFTIEVISAIYAFVRVTETGSSQSSIFAASAISLGDYATGSLAVPRDGLNVGDKLLVAIDDLGGMTTTIVEGPFGLEGLSQLYTHFHNYRAYELSYSADKSRLTSWVPKLAYRFNTLIDTDVLKVKANDAVVDSSGYNVYLKETELQSASWLTGLRITLVRKGSTQQVNNKPVPAVASVGQRGDDWLYRVDLTNDNHPALEWYEYEETEYDTFFALSGKSSNDEWRKPTRKILLRSLNGPFIVKGLQALVTFIFGYADRAAELGFIFNDPNDPVTDPSTGRLVGWQLLIEELIDSQFNNPSDGGVFELAPFKDRLWFKTAYGFVSDLSKTGSSRLIPGLYTTGSVRAPKGSFRVFRDGASASITSDVPLTGALITTSVFEHVLVLDKQVGDITITDPFLGQHVERIFLEGFKQATPTGRPIYNGKYLVGNKMRTNMEGAVQQLGSLYDIAALKSEELFDRASSLISFDRKDYHTDLGTTLPTQLQFWRGMLKSKGTNRAVSSFINSSLYRSALIDEMWAYKLAEYGDIRRAVKVELNVRADDMLGDRANYLFLEKDELAYVKTYLENGGYDMTIYDELAYDMYTLYTNEQLINMDIVDPRGTILLQPDDEARWNSFTDLGSISYMKAIILAEMILAPTSISTFYTIRNSNGKDVLADCFELVDLDALTENVYDVPVIDITSYVRSGSKVYRERGDYIVGTNPPEYSLPKFKRINASQLQILDPSLLGKRLKVIAYGPPTKRFTPSELYRDDGGRDTPINRNVIWWDPARGTHSPEAHAIVDYQASQDPARYNVTYLKHKAKPADAMRVWGQEQVGKVWWNTNNAGWMKYYDSKLYFDHNERLAQWGSLADWASIDLFEWVESDKDPSQWAGTGEPGIRNNLTRSRTWYQRPVVWLYSANPQVAPKTPLKSQTVALALESDGVLLAVDGVLPKFAVNERLAKAVYTDVTRTELKEPVGMLEVVTGDVVLVIGSSTSNTVPTFAATPSFTDVKIVTTTIALDTPPHGALTLDYEIENDIVYIRATSAATSQSQRTILIDTPVKAGTAFEISFAQLGFKLQAKAVYGQADAWGGLGVLTQAQRATRAGIELGSAMHDIVIRQAVKTHTLIDPGVTSFEGSAAVGTTDGWISWLEPQTKLTADDDLDANFGSWDSLTGAWVAIGTALNDKKLAITQELTSPQPVRQFEERWTSWRAVVGQTKESTYYTTVSRTHLQALEELSFAVPIEDMSRAVCYVNGRRIAHGARAVVGTSGCYMYIPEISITTGSTLRVELAARMPTAAELKLKLEGMALDPTKLVEYKLDTPYVKHEERNEFGRVSKTRYFFWVKNKETPGSNKKLSVKLAAQQLKQHPGPYAVPQIMKRFNQLDGRPNRYAMLTVVDLSRFVRKDNQYKLRITENGSMRDDDENITLRTTHAEWKLVRKNQPTRISKELWDKLVDTLCGETATGQTLPFAVYAEYDARNGTTSRIGLKQGQVLSDSTQALATVKGTLLDTQVVTYDVTTGSFVSAPLQFIGYDSSALDTYLASSTSIREFMAAVWTYGAPRNINELFFAVLEDALAATSELADIMKTSFVTLDEVRTVVVEG